MLCLAPDAWVQYFRCTVFWRIVLTVLHMSLAAYALQHRYLLTDHEDLAVVQACAFLAVAVLELVWPQFVNALLGYTKELAVRQVGAHLSDKQQGRGALQLVVVCTVAAAKKAS